MFSKSHKAIAVKSPKGKVIAKAMAGQEATTPMKQPVQDVWAQPSMPSVAFPKQAAPDVRTPEIRTLAPLYFREEKTASRKATAHNESVAAKKSFTPSREDFTLSKNYYPERAAS